MYTLENDLLKIAVKQTGAELCQISSVKYNTQFMWNADPDVWGSYAPNLFPIIGALKNNTYKLEGKDYTLPKHGFLRYNKKVKIHEHTANSLTFKLKYDDESLKVYPFKFEFYITYTLNETTIDITHNIKNKDDATMFFSLGGHPAFKCPVYVNETYTDYSLEFEYPETSETHLINMDNGLISNQKVLIFNNNNSLQLSHDLFNKDALIFKDLKSKKVTLKSKHSGEILSVTYKDFPYLGIWAKPNGNYVCIEPWLGIADNDDTDQNLKTKEGILQLAPHNTFNASYSIEIPNKHLV